MHDTDTNTLGRCSICGADGEESVLSLWFIGSDGSHKAICSSCDEQVERCENEKDTAAAAYLQKKLPHITDAEVARQLRSMLREIQKDLLFPSANADDGIWISGLRLIGYIVFFGFIIAGFVAGTMTGHFGAFCIWFFGAVLTAFLLVAFIMVFLDLASDIKAIRNKLQSR